MYKMKNSEVCKNFFFFKLIGLEKLQIKVSVLFQRDLLVSFPTDEEVIKKLNVMVK